MNKWFRSLFTTCNVLGQFVYEQVSMPGELKVSSNEILILCKFKDFSFNVEDCQGFYRSLYACGQVSICWKYLDEEFMFVFGDSADFDKVSYRLGGVFGHEQVCALRICLNLGEFYDDKVDFGYFGKGELFVDDSEADKEIFVVVAKYSHLLSALDILKNSDIILRTWLSPKFDYSIDLVSNKLEWYEYENNSQRKWTIVFIKPISDLHNSLSMLLKDLSKNQEFSNPIPKNIINTQISNLPEQRYSNFYQVKNENLDEITDSVISSSNEHIFVAHKNFLSVLSNDSLSLISKQSLEHTFNSKDFVPIHLLPSPTKLFTVNQNDPGSVYTFDFSRNKIISSHKLPENSIIKDLNFPTRSYSSDFLALTSNSLYKIDPRSVNYIAAEYSYETSQGLECFTPTASGQLAVGTSSGEVKLYSKVGQKAKTRFPGFGQQIIAIDCSDDGQWILATALNYLMLIPTVAYGVNGFLASISKKSKKIRQLRIKDSDMKLYGIENLAFKPACFGKDKKNEVVVAGIGRFLVVWDFNMVQKGKVDRYKVVPTEQEVVKNQVLKGRGAVVVTFKEKVEVCDGFFEF